MSAELYVILVMTLTFGIVLVFTLYQLVSVRLLLRRTKAAKRDTAGDPTSPGEAGTGAGSSAHARHPERQ